MDTFQDKLKIIENSDLYPFHMPGHKRVVINEDMQNPYRRDITEIDGYDNLHCAEGFILEEEKFAAGLFGAEESFYLVNGSSCGILAAMMTVSEKERKFLLARNAHKSVFHGLYLTDRKADFVYPQVLPDVCFAGSVSVEDIRKKLETEKYAAILITSPTYEGIVSDIQSICNIAHERGIPVIVDEAHGAHLGIFGADDYFPRSAVQCGADLVVQSTHKTLPAMTQTALLHVQGSFVDRKKLKYYLSVFQSSSPSYILMESISDSLHYCSEHKEELLQQYKKQLKDFYRKTIRLKNIRIFQSDSKRCPAKDPAKLVICIRGGICFTGKQLYDILREKYHLQMEMAGDNYVIAMTSMMDRDEGFDRLIGALSEIDEMLDSSKNDDASDKKNDTPRNAFKEARSVLSVRQAMDAEKEYVSVKDAIGKCCGEFLYLYPPGIPILIPGEYITKEAVLFLKTETEAGLFVQGGERFDEDLIACLKFN